MTDLLDLRSPSAEPRRAHEPRPDDDRPRAIATRAVPVDPERHRGLRRWNLGAAALHGVSAAAMLVLATDVSLPITMLQGGEPGLPASERAVQTVADVPLAPWVAAFMVLSALFHLLVAAPGVNGWYRREIEAGRNRFRWVEYSLSSTLMIVLISLIVSLTDLGALIGIAAANVAMILFGWVMEMVNGRRDRAWMSPFWFGSIAGAAPWIAVLATITVSDGPAPPTFVYGILVSIFLLFNCFAVNQFLQYRRIGPWRDYVVGEKTYIVLSLVAKSALAWQIYANVLVG